MKVIGITSTAILSLLLGIAAPARAQQEQQGEKQGRPEQQRGGHEQGKPEQQHSQQERQPQHARQQPEHDQQQQQQHAQEQQQQHAQQQQQRHPQEQQDQQQRQHAQQQQPQRPSQPERSNQQSQRSEQQQRVERSAWQQHRAQDWQSDHRTWQQRGGYHGYRVPDDRFRGYFGPNHGFRINTLPFLVVGGYPRFQYDGYWISAVDPWPEYWGNDWYDTDDVYVNYADNGYYLYNRRYPTAPGIAISISF
jgi:hypothetical protein